MSLMESWVFHCRERWSQKKKSYYLVELHVPFFSKSCHNSTHNTLEESCFFLLPSLQLHDPNGPGQANDSPSYIEMSWKITVHANICCLEFAEEDGTFLRHFSIRPLEYWLMHMYDKGQLSDEESRRPHTQVQFFDNKVSGSFVELFVWDMPSKQFFPGWWHWKNGAWLLSSLCHYWCMNFGFLLPCEPGVDFWQVEVTAVLSSSFSYSNFAPQIGQAHSGEFLIRVRKWR